MKKITIEEMAKKLENFKGTTFLGITTLTTQDEYYVGIDPITGEKSSKVANKMITTMGIDPNEIKKQAISNVLLTTCSYKTLLENIRKREIDADVAEFMKEFSFNDLDAEIKFQESFEQEKAKEYELGERKNGTNVNGVLVRSKKDNHPMINIYFRTNNFSKISYFLNGESFDESTISKYRKPPKKDSEKQKAFGIKKCLTIRNYRLENVKSITWAGETYEIEG